MDDYSYIVYDPSFEAEHNRLKEENKALRSERDELKLRIENAISRIRCFENDAECGNGPWICGLDSVIDDLQGK